MFVIVDLVSKQYAVLINGAWKLTPNVVDAHQFVLAAVAEEVVVTEYPAPTYMAVVEPAPPVVPPTAPMPSPMTP